MSDEQNTAEQDTEPVVAPVEDSAPTIAGTVGDKVVDLSLRLYVIPRGDAVKPDYIAACNMPDARRGAEKFFGELAATLVSRAVKRPATGSRVLVQIQDRDSKPDHLGFVMQEWSKELHDEVILKEPQED